MTHYSHDISPALAARADLKAAYERRLPMAQQALAHWLQSTSPDFKAICRSVEDADLTAVHHAATHLTKNTSDVVVLGIGGSSLGAQTLAQLADWGTPAYAPAEGRPRIHIVDNLDGATFAKLLSRLDLRTTRFLAVSKSGSTTEPLMQTLAAIKALEAAGGGKYLKHHFAGITEVRDNPLFRILGDMGAPILAHDPNLGGRYSVLSVVGLLPAMLLGLDPQAIRAGARATLAHGHAAVEGAALNAAARDVGLSQSVMWAYADRLHYFPKWWRQLWAESLGKAGQGTTPIDALGPVDQHSQLQLYLDGPKDKLFTLIEAHSDADAKADETWARKHDLALYAGRGMAEVVAVQARATAETLHAHTCPARRIAIPKLNEESLGALLAHFILETLIAARLWDVDPFGQPAVEEGKLLTRKYLGGPA